MIRWLVAGLIVVGLAVGIFVLWPRESSDPPPTTVPIAVETTTTTLVTTTSAPPTTSTTEDTHIVATVGEAEEILRALWFGWFEGIYNQDEDRIGEVVGTQAMLEAAREQFGVMEFDREPRATDLTYSDSEILRADEDCLVVWTTTRVSGFNKASTTDVHVLRSRDDRWGACLPVAREERLVGHGLRISIGAALTGLIVLAPLAAIAEEFSACWVAEEPHPVFGGETQITRCRISSGEVVDYANDDSVPSRLYPNIGFDLLGECWYVTSTETNYQIVPLNPGGGAELVLIVDGSPGPSGYFRRCTSEPGVTVDPSEEAWDYVMSYVHPPPTPDLNPSPGDGITGLETFVGVPIPDVHETQLSSGTGATLDIHIEVSGVVVDWGDDRVDTFPAELAALAGYPDGAATHVYEVKDLTGYDLSISYAWTARWRVVGEDWESLDVPDTTTSVVYPVAEIVSVITD